MISEKLLIYLPQIEDFEINVDSTVRSFMLLLAGAKAYIERTTSWVQNVATTPFEVIHLFISLSMLILDHSWNLDSLINHRRFIIDAFCWRSSGQHTSARTRRSQRSNHQREEPATGQTGRANQSDRLGAENPAKSKTSSSGVTPSELEDLGLSWSRQATQDALERRRDERRTARDWKS